MKTRVYPFIVLLTAISVSCSIHEKDNKIESARVFYAQIETPSGSEQTKVYADDDLYVLWHADDRVSIFDKNTYNQEYRFTGKTGANAGSFEKVDNGGFITGNAISSVYSVYPFKESTEISNQGVLSVYLPATQSYAENSFGLKANTMVSVSSDNLLMFKNVGGYLRLSLYGDGVSVSSITLRGNNGEKLAGKATVTMPQDGTPTITMAQDASEEITLVCDTPVALGATAEESVDFWFVVPPAIFSQGFSVIVKDRKGRFFEKTTARSIDIQRNNLAKMSAFEVIPTGDGDVITLSEVESANCYIVEKEGEYCFDATTIGNGEKGIFDQQYFHTSTPFISPKKVSLLWQDSDLISNLSLSDGIVYFSVSANKGNALISVSDNEDVVLWSWHIWVTDKPNEIQLTSSTHTYLDRNLGAISCEPGSDSSIGLFYQWGRKDPLNSHFSQLIEKPEPLSIQYLIQNPTLVPLSSPNYTGWVQTESGTLNVGLWGNPDGIVSVATHKTIYDPCPAGYTIPSDDAWYEYGSVGNPEHRYYALYDQSIILSGVGNGIVVSKDAKSLYYPVVAPLYDQTWSGYGLYYRNDCNLSWLGSAPCVGFSVDGEYGYAMPNMSSKPDVPLQIRCIKEETFLVFPPNVETKSAKDIDVNTMTLVGNVSSDGNTPVTGVGFVWGLSQSNMSNRIKASFNQGSFSTVLEGIPSHSTVYYRAYAENAAGVSYGNTMSVPLPSVTEYTINQLDGLSRLMTKQYLSTQGMNGEGTIRHWYCDLQGVSMSTPQTGLAQLWNSDYLTNTSSVYGIFPLVYYYGIINRVNNLLDNYIPLADEYDPNIGYYTASLLGYRAYAYTMLVQLYCKSWNKSNNGQSQGVPLRIKTNEDVTVSTSLSRVYQQIYSDLDTAIALMRSSSISRKEVNEIDIRVLYAIYAKAALNKNDYSTALDYAKLARTDHPLMTNQEYNAGFSVSNQEWIWGAHPDNTYEGGIQLYYYSYFSYIGSNSSSSNSRNYPKSISKVLFERIPKTDFRKSLWLDPSGYTYDSDTGEASSSLSSYAKLNYQDALYPSSKVYAYMQFKFRNLSQPGLGQMNFIRAAEMVLIEAEANYYLGNETETRSLLLYLNQQSGRDPQYQCEKSGAELLDELKFYRRIELWGEGYDWFDLKRWDDPVVRLSFAEGGNFMDVFAGTWSASDKNDFVWVMPDNYEQYIREGVEE